MSGEENFWHLRMGHAAVDIHHKGAHITSWKDSDGVEQLYLSPQSSFEPNTAVRGGIPIIFPQFADQGNLPKHGFLRSSSNWQKIEKFEDEESIGIVLSHQETPETQKVWENNCFQFILRVTLFDNGNKLQCHATIKNNNSEGGNELKTQVCFHTYFNVNSITSVGIKGLKNISYVDKVNGNNDNIETRDVVTIGEEVDRIYQNVGGDVSLCDSVSGKSLVISKSNMEDIVVWNPWVDKARSIGDLPDEGFHSFVCIETGQIANPFNLAPQSSVDIKQTLNAYSSNHSIVNKL